MPKDNASSSDDKSAKRRKEEGMESQPVPPPATAYQLFQTIERDKMKRDGVKRDAVGLTKEISLEWKDNAIREVKFRFTIFSLTKQRNTKRNMQRKWSNIGGQLQNG
jgi:hypothetical protein